MSALSFLSGICRSLAKLLLKSSPGRCSKYNLVYFSVHVVNASQRHIVISFSQLFKVLYFFSPALVLFCSLHLIWRWHHLVHSFQLKWCQQSTDLLCPANGYMVLSLQGYGTSRLGMFMPQIVLSAFQLVKPKPYPSLPCQCNYPTV